MEMGKSSPHVGLPGWAALSRSETATLWGSINWKNPYGLLGFYVARPFYTTLVCEFMAKHPGFGLHRPH